MKKYPKIRTVGHREVENLLPGEDIVVQEKIDGSNFTFGRDAGGELFCLSRNQKLSMADGADNGMFNKAVAFVKSIADGVPLATLFRCEYLQSPKHGVINYSRVPLNNLVLFEVEGQNSYGDWVPATLIESGIEHYALKFGIEPVRFFHSGELGLDGLIDSFDKWMQTESQLGGTRPEGVVIKNRRAFTESGEMCRAKLVRQEFKEQMAHNKEAGKPNTVHELGFRFGGKPRWQKAIQHLKEQGLIKGGPEDIGILMREIGRDVEEECIDEIKDALWKRFRKDVLSGAAQGFVDWYKKEIGLLQ